MVADAESTVKLTHGVQTNLTMTLNGTAPFNLQWLRDNASIPGATSPRISIGPASRIHAGAYRLTVSNPFGQTISSNRTIRVLVPQQLQQPQAQPDGTLRVAFNDFDIPQSGSPEDFEIQWSSDLRAWFPLTNATVESVGQHNHLVIPEFASLPAAFIRVISD